MSRWFRFYDDALNDPKVQRLPGEKFKAWVNLLCLASKNDGVLPALPDIAFSLRVDEETISVLLNEFYSLQLLDETEVADAPMSYRPHNWDQRQYKSDVSTDRVRRFRNGKRNVSETPPEQSRTDTESEQKDSEANASGADAPIDHRKRLFDEGLPKLAGMTGKGPDACRSFVGKCLKAASDDAIVVLGLIEDAERNRVADPSAWIAARLKATGPPTAKPLTAYQQSRQETKDILDGLDNFASGGGFGGEANPRLLSGNSGERSEGLRGGPGADVIDLPAASGRARG